MHDPFFLLYLSKHKDKKMKSFSGFQLILLILVCVVIVFGCKNIANKTLIKNDNPETEATKQAVSIEQYMQIKSASKAQGGLNDAVYFVGWDSGVNQLYMISGEKKYQLTKKMEFPEGIDGYLISPDGKYAVIVCDQGGDEQYDLSLMDMTSYSIIDSIDHGRDVRADSVLWQPDSNGLYYRSTRRNKTDFDIWHYNALTHETSIFLEREGYNWLNDISEDGKQMMFSRYRGGHNIDLFEVVIKTKSVRQITPGNNEEGYYDSALYSADNSEIYLITDKGLETTALAKMNTANGQWNKLSTYDWAVEHLAVSNDSKILAYTFNEHGYSKLELRKTANFEKIELPELPDGISIISELEFTDNELLFVASDARHTSEVWELNLNTMLIRQVSKSDYVGIDAAGFIKPELVFYESFDGLKIPAFLYRPKGSENKLVPYMIYAHGGPESQFRPQFIRNFQYLAERGIGVLAPNVRGSDGYGQEYLALDNYKKRYDSIKDFRHAAKWLIDNKIADKDKIAISGGSYGGFVVMACITEYPDLFAAAIDKVGVVNYLTYFKNTKEYRRKVRESEYGPVSDPEFLKSISPIFKIDRVETPLLVVHGENDPRVPVSEARQIIESLEKQNKSVQALIFPDEGHGIGKLENRLLYYKTMAEFLINNLKP